LTRVSLTIRATHPNTLCRLIEQAHQHPSELNGF
jgi:hypothetical protein